MGYKTVMPIQLANLLYEYDEDRIGLAGLRCFFGLLEMQAIRDAAQRVRTKPGKKWSRFKAGELCKLTGLTERTVRASVKRLAPVVTVDIRTITFQSSPIPGSEELLESFRCQRSERRPVPIPRPMIRWLARSESVVTIKVVIGYLLRGMSIDRATSEIRAKGTLKATWLVENFGISRRAVKYAQCELRKLGWVSKDTKSHQLKLNSTGAYFEIDVNWKPGESEVEKSACKTLTGGASFFANQGRQAHTTPVEASAPTSRRDVSSSAASNRIPGLLLEDKNENTDAQFAKASREGVRATVVSTTTPLPKEEARDLAPIPCATIATGILAQFQTARRVNAQHKAQIAGLSSNESPGNRHTIYSSPTTNHSPQIAPLPAKIGTPIAPPYKDQRTLSEKYKDQRTHTKAGDFESGKINAPHRLQRPPECHETPRITAIQDGDLFNAKRMEVLFRQACDRGWVKSCEADWLKFVAGAVRAREVGNSPAALFAGILRKRLWHHITQGQEDQARYWLKRAFPVVPRASLMLATFSNCTVIECT